MELNKKSFHALIYQYFYNTETLPVNLCPYFWKLVTAFVFVIPYTIVCLPHLIIKRRLIDPYNISFFERLGIGAQWHIGIVTSFMVIFLWYHALLAAFGAYSYNSGLATAGSIIFWFLIAIVLLFTFLMYADNRQERYEEPKKPNIIVEFIKAKYNRYCPKINWN